MFDKIKQKLNGSDAETATTQQPNKATPSINEPSSTTSSSPTNRGSIDDQPRGSRLSVSDDRGRRTSLSVDRSRTASKSRSRSRARDVLWKNSLFDPSNPQSTPKDPNLRAKSLSVNAPHPTMAEEDMKKMPYADWSKKN